jgi:UPF0755 protein
MMKKKNFLFLLALIGVIGMVWAYVRYFKPNVVDFTGKKYLYIRTGSGWKEVIDSLNSHHLLIDENSFNDMAVTMGVDKQVHPGRYALEPGMSNYSLLKLLRSGVQSPVKLTLNKLRTKEQIIHKLSSQLEPDSTAFARLFSDSTFLNSYGIGASQIQVLFMPNTYELYWNTSSEKVISKIAKSHQQFWNAERKARAKQLNLSIPDIITLASIVEEETNKHDEKPRIASVYLNRLKIGMKLGADPTVKFAVGDFTLRRILNIHTQKASPYNTYQVAGLPPGPICTPGKESIEAVLNHEETKYLFFCAKEDFSGYHNFASTYNEHLENARRYQQALNQRNIK